MFSQDELAKIVNETLPTTLPNGRSSAIVGTVDKNGVGFVAKFDKDTTTGNWELQMAVRRDWNGNTNVGTKVIWSF